MCKVSSILCGINWPRYGLAVTSRTDLCCVQIICHVKQVQYVEPQEDHIFFHTVIFVTVQLWI
jgi:hypothetical protein